MLDIRDSDGKWLNSAVFREEGIKFMKNGYYCSHPKDSADFMDYWTEQLKRCENGYEVRGHKITGHHYSYLNFSEIEVADDSDPDAVSTIKETKPPDFWDGDYDYYWSLEIAKNGLFSKYAIATSLSEKMVYKQLPPDEQANEKQRILKRIGLRVIPHPDYLDGGNHMIVGKSRRKGYSFKNADICKNTYNTTRKSLCVIGAFDKKYLYPKGTMDMASKYLSYINTHTAWRKAREYTDKVDIKTASFVKMVGGTKTEAGYLSTIMAVSFGDNPDAARGKDAKYVLFEEAGVFPNLIESYKATRPGLSAGKYITGQMLVFGTGGDMESGTVDFAKMFYNPIEYGAMPFVNIWDENAELTYCGFFHPVYMNMEGYYDEQGNSDVIGAITYEKGIRDALVKASSSSLALQGRVQEFPLCPSEAFLTVSTNDFPIVELRARYAKVKREGLNVKYGQPVYLGRENGKLGARPDLDNVLEPIWDYQPKIKDLSGSVVMYEWPIEKPPKGLYKIGFDPYRQERGTSLACIYVYKCSHKFSYTRDQIVAQFIGRPYSPDTVNRIAELLAELYNAEIMHENEVTHVKAYFTKIKKLHLLCAQPDLVIGKTINKSTVARNYGIHMVEKLKDAGEKYIKQWLLTVRDIREDGSPIYNLDTICDLGLLEELMYYNRKGNFDRVMAFMMVMFQIEEEEEEGKQYGEEEDYSSNADDLLEMMKNQYKRGQ